MGRLSLTVLGTPEVRHVGLAIAFPTRKALALLVYLAVEGGTHSREKLTALFWPESGQLQGRGTLRRTLAYLHQSLNAPRGSHLLAERESLAFEPSDATLDVWEIQAGLQASPPAALARLTAAALLCRGEFLEGFSLPDCPRFDDWAGVQREVWHRKTGQLFDRLSEQQAGAGQRTAAIETAARWVAQDPLNESAQRRLIERHAANGDRASAMAAYDACRNLLRRELDTEPSTETQALAQRVRAQQGSPVTDFRGPAPAAPPADLPLLGRAFEQECLVGVFRLARQGRFQVATIAGEPGIGKTRLAREFLAWAATQGVITLEGRAFQAGGQLAYQPIIEALRDRLAYEADPRHLLADSWWAELSRILPELSEQWRDLPSPWVMSEQESRTRLLEAVAQLGQALAATGPVVLFLDDLQWVDPASLELLQYAARRWVTAHAPVMLILTLRSDDLATTPALADWLAGLAHDVALTRLLLGRLSQEETRQLAWAIGLGGQDSPGGLPSSFTAFSQQLYVETDGHPFFIIQTLRSLAERGLLRRNEAGEWIANLDQEIPGSIKELIRARLARLGTGAQILCAAGAVLGDGYECPLLCEVAEVGERAEIAAYEALLARGLLRESGGRYFFTHDRIREVIYGDISEARRRLLHRRALEALETRSSPAAKLSDHAQAAGLDDRAFQFSLAAGDEAMRVFAVSNALRHYDSAEHFMARVTGPAVVNAAQHLYAQFGRAYELNNDRHSARAVYERMLAVARRSDDALMECGALNRLATLAAQAHEYPQAAGLLQTARQVAEAGGNEAGLAETEWALAQLAIYLQDGLSAHAHGNRSLELARKTGEAELTARSLNVVAFAELALAEVEAVIVHGREASARYAVLGNPAMQADSAKLVADALMRDGRLAEGLALVRQTLATCEQFGNVWGQGSCLMHLACGLADQGDYAPAIQAIERGLAIAGDTPYIPLLLRGVLGAIHRALLELGPARLIHHDLLEFAASQDLPLGVQAIFAAELCADCVAAGQWADAITYARQAAAYTGHDVMPVGHMLWPETLALVKAGDLDLVASGVARYGRGLAKYRRYLVCHLRARAVLAEAQGNSGQVQAGLCEAVALAESIGLPGDLWPLHAALGEMQTAARITRELAANLSDERQRENFLAETENRLAPIAQAERPS